MSPAQRPAPASTAGCGSSVAAAGPTRRRRCGARRRPSTAAPTASTASDPADDEEQPPRLAGSADRAARAAARPRRSRWSRPNSVAMPAAAATTAATTPIAGSPSGSSRYENRPTAPNATKPATPTNGRRTDALPSTRAERERHDDDADDERDLVVGAEQGDGEVLQRRREAVDELRADGRDQRRLRPADPAHELADAERHAGRDDTGERAVDAPHGRRRRWLGGPIGLRRQLGRDGHGCDGTPADPSRRAFAKRSRNSRRPARRPARRAYCRPS